MTKVKTVTLTYKDNPTSVICPGHVDQKTFNQAHKNEGWNEGGYKQKDLSYVYLTKRKTKKGFLFNKSIPGKPGAKPYTWASWD